MKKTLLLVVFTFLMAGPLIAVDVEGPGWTPVVQNGSRVCIMCADQVVLDYLKARGLSERLVLMDADDLHLEQAIAIEKVCSECHDELCCLIKSRMAWQLSQGYDAVRMSIGHKTWFLDKFGRFVAPPIQKAGV